MNLRLQSTVLVGQPIRFSAQIFVLQGEFTSFHMLPDHQQKNNEEDTAALNPEAVGLRGFSGTHRRSKTRRRALRARGLTATSSGLAWSPLRKTSLPQGAIPQMHCGARGGQTQPFTAA